ncbi:membrane metallo-endopeptidase-like 1, partial [Leptotrombidium deliense]
AKIVKQIDESISPCHDFYSFACGGLEKAFTVIPEDRSNLWSASLLQLNIDQKLKAFIENISSEDEDNYLSKIKVSYEQCVDQESIEVLGNSPLEMVFDQIGGWPVLQGKNWTDSIKNLTERLTKLKEIGLRFDVFFELQVLPHVIDESFNAIYLGNPLLVLDDRGYYEKNINDTVLRSYYEFMIDASILLGAPSEIAKKEMLEVLQFEINLTKIMAPKDPKGNVYNPRNFSELNSMAPAIDWKYFFNQITSSIIRIPDDYYVILESPDYITNLSGLIQKTDNRILANYIGWRTVVEMTALLDNNWGVVARRLYRHLDGRLRLLPRWKFCINLVKKYFNIGVSSLYVQRTPEVRKQIKVVKRMVNEIRSTYLNYGSIGWVIGHEITHGFDDSGRLFDENGEYNEWWTNNTKKEFDRKAECFVEQYNNYTSPMTGMKLNGMLTLGENIADNGGIKQAYRAYEKHASKDPLLPGLNYSQLQLFFIQSASVSVHYLSLTDFVNESINFRIIGTMSNFAQFATAFHCNKQSAMNPKKRCELW